MNDPMASHGPEDDDTNVLGQAIVAVVIIAIVLALMFGLSQL